MSGLEALGVACNVMQLLSFTREVFTTCRNIYKNGTINADLDDTAECLEFLSGQVYDSSQKANLQTDDEIELSKVAKKCNIVARSLEEELRYLTKRRDASGHFLKAVFLGLQYSWRSGRLERLQKSLSSCQIALESRLIANIWNKCSGLTESQRQGFKDLDKRVEYFISQYQDGHRQVQDLVHKGNLTLETHIQRQYKSHEETLRTGFDNILKHQSSMQHTTIDQGRHERLLKSLKFETMNMRQNNMVKSHEDTFTWIFEDANSNSKSQTYQSGSEFETERDQRCTNSWDNFADWLKSESKFYWISGKPGSGKSTLMKFLVESPATADALRIWNDDIFTISYFFWKPGSYMQKSIKGLLSTLLHQLLSHNSQIMEVMLQQHGTLHHKDTENDWSVEELNRALFAVLKSYPSNLCIFIDGLDEACDEDRRNLLMLANSLRVLPRIKVCVSSRPEPIFKKKFEQLQHLRLQDLTESDMKKYTRDTLQSTQDSGSMTVKERDDLAYSLVYKAEGVFLWLHLAVQNIQQGIDHGNSHEMLLKRLDDLPSGLMNLYKDMWQRVNGNTKVYRRDSARYFNLLIAATDMAWDLSDLDAVIPMFLLATAKDLGDRNIGPEPVSYLTPDYVENHYEEVQLEIETRCAGLIRMVPTRYYEKNTKDNGEKDEEEIHKKSTMGSSFIHRTALDFLTDTDEGILIRKDDTSNTDLRFLQLSKAMLAYMRLLIKLGREVDPDMAFNLPLFNRYILVIRDSEFDEMIQFILKEFFHFYIENFPSLFMIHDAMTDILYREGDTPAISTKILYEVFKKSPQWLYNDESDLFAQPGSFIKFLMSRGADPDAPNAKRISDCGMDKMAEDDECTGFINAENRDLLERGT
ncbi:hypothetical protein CDD81_5419 [Ophiocordyceps australis]|uniref:NACHT domain-containing protein n=1 Tax=Ophiocordyceps australis TaxID=1399860 RepID=A0A2C5Y9D9_9HYPO|nr:hypothetical protein CDD81_5419 [Ophiocordyceps australis]